MIITTGGGRGGGTHGSLSRYDMNNTLVASGPDLKRGLISDIPSGNIDLAPTVLDILGITVPPSMDGRVLREAYAKFDGPKPLIREQRHGAIRRLGFIEWTQYLQTSTVEGSLYFDEGNGHLSFH